MDFLFNRLDFFKFGLGLSVRASFDRFGQSTSCKRVFLLLGQLPGAPTTCGVPKQKSFFFALITGTNGFKEKLDRLRGFGGALFRPNVFQIYIF